MDCDEIYVRRNFLFPPQVAFGYGVRNPKTRIETTVFITHSSGNGDVGYFHVLAILNVAVINKHAKSRCLWSRK